MAEDYERIAQASGDPRLIANAEAFRLKIDELAASAHELEKKFTDIAEGSFATFITDVATGTKTITQAFRDMAKNIITELDKIWAKQLAQQLVGNTDGGGFLQSMVGSLIGGALGGGAGSGILSGDSPLSATGDMIRGRRAAGGSVDYNAAYLVGEKGPELFVPGASGTIVPNGAMGGNVIHIHVNVPQSTSRQTADQIAAQTGMAVNRALRRNA